MFDDDDPMPKPELLAKPPLDRLGVAELEGYVASLRAEILRVEAEISRKNGLRSAAENVFRRP